ncbi:MAG TPA: hypothetical protein PLP99_07665 [Ignavibacteriales bacterium]|nr:hypothetical protein [Ignavibacteriales bacterium]HOL81618.1 hypothetical protein [Ignavibacteriales bacterium]
MKKSTKISIVFISLFFSSCIYWQDFNAYFNLYYNASTIFEKAEKSYISQKKDVFEFVEPNPSGNLNNDLVKVVEKCSKILQNYTETNLIPKAIMLTGKALYYQTSFVRAKRKFNEMLAEKISYDDSLWAIFWLAKTDMRLGNHTEGLQKYDLLLQNRELPDEIKEQVYLEQIKYYKYKNDKPNLVISLNYFVKISNDESILPNAYMLLGDIYYSSNDFLRAMDAYKKIDNFPVVNNELLFNSKKMYIKCLQKLNKNQEAGVQLLKLRKNLNYSQFFSDIDLELANIILNLNDTSSAFALYLAIDTLYKNSIAAAISNYQIAKLYENRFKKLDSAFAYYSKASKMVLPKELLDTTNIKLGVYSKYNQYKNNIYEILYVILKKDTIITLMQKCDSTSQYYDKSDTISQKVLEEYIKKFEKDAIYAKYKNFSKDSLNNLLGENYFELSLIFENDLGLLDSALVLRKLIAQNHKNSRVYPLNLYMLSLNEEKVGNKNVSDSLLNIIYNNYPYTELANFVAKKIGKQPYIIEKDSAAIKFEQIKETDDYRNNIMKYKNIIKNYPNSIYAVKSLLVIGDIFEYKLKKYDSAYAYYKSAIIKGENIVPKRIKNKVDMYEKFIAKTTSDTVALALGNVTIGTKDVIQNEIKNEEKNVMIKEDKVDIQYEMNMFDIRTVLERRKKRTIW